MSADTLVEDFARMLEGVSDEEALAYAYNSPAIHFTSCVTILDKNKQPLPNPIPNILQLRMSAAYETLLDLGVLKIRIICVKPRQVGCSTFAQHIVYHFGQTRPVEGIVISDISKHSTELLEKLKSYGKTDRFPWGHSMHALKNTVSWENGTHWTVDSAENENAGVGGTRNAGHFSEVAKWPQTERKNAVKTMSAVLPSINGEPSVVIAESTPEGAFGWFYSTYCEAVTIERMIEMVDQGIAPEECWVKVFAAWWEFAEHRKHHVSETERNIIESTLSKRESDGILKYGWDWNQIAWRRETIASKCNGSQNLFDCYYPEDDVTCWTASGNPRFDLSVVLDLEAMAKGSIPETGELVTQDNGRVHYSRQEDGKGSILIWEPPTVGMRYVVACDPATGESNTTGADPDRTSIQVWRARYLDEVTKRIMPPRLVARLVSPFYGDDDIAAAHIVRLSKYYGNALVALEVNQGLQVLRLLKDESVPLYKRPVTDAKTGKPVLQYGFKLVSDDQRRLVIETLAAAIRNRDIEVFCPKWLHEAKVFVTKPSGRSEAAQGEHDDDILCAAMALEILPSATPFTEQKIKMEDPPDRRRWKPVNALRKPF